MLAQRKVKSPTLPSPMTNRLWDHLYLYLYLSRQVIFVQHVFYSWRPSSICTYGWSGHKTLEYPYFSIRDNCLVHHLILDLPKSYQFTDALMQLFFQVPHY